MAKILICDDERDIVNALKIYLSQEDYMIYEAFNGVEALDVLKKERIDPVLLDIMMPEMDGLEAIMHIRQTTTIPIIFLTAKGEDTDKILGLNVGADDYITKPFNPMEVIARVKSQLRRYRQFNQGYIESSHILKVGGLELNDETKSVSMDGKHVRCTPTEFEILKFLMAHPNRVFSPKQIYEQVWQDHSYGAEGTVAVHIRHLREKLEINPSEPRYFKVVWGQGYKIEGDINHESK
ncbi:DNA-binding response regulator [Erysipelothrix piscisicarius]|uniref:DNA-binding response regulator n=2 Tax=Erysipelothrix TaxID=1647 RepID=A0A3S8RM59_9FIRM|nr:response regulator transcription factor [Erysipelothrix piscisicarius]AZK43953.1 DNA-binding response regulator [Erysipelothrix piscisicarius]